MRRLPIVLILGLALAACGGHGSASSKESDQIESSYTTFFSGKTSVADRVALLQNGPRYKKVIQSFASNPLAKNVTAKVSKVTLTGANKAKVVYVIQFAGTSLPKQTGTAVRQNGKWKVGDASLCKLISLGGTTPVVCLHRKS